MEESERDVNPEESSPSEEQVSEKEVDATTAESPEQKTTEQQSTQEQGQAQDETVDEMGVPWKNRAMEWQRKFQETANEENIRRVANEVLEQQKKHQTQEKEYTIAELEQFAIANPSHRPWVEEQKAIIIQKNVAKITDEKVREVEGKQREALVRQQSEAWVVNHPRLQECMTLDPMGRKVFNPAHPVTQMMGQYMNDPDMKRRPDALVIAAKLALADYMDAQANKSQKKVKTLEQNLKKIQKATLVEGGTSQQDAIKTRTKYSKAMDALQSTGSKEALREVLKAKLGIEG